MPTSKKKKTIADVGAVLRKVNDPAALRSWAEYMVTVDPWKALGYTADELAARFERDRADGFQFFSAATSRGAKTQGFEHEHGLIAFLPAGALATIERLSKGAFVPQTGDGGYIAALVTKNRRKGFGKYLVHASERVIREKSDQVYVLVSETNMAAQRFYKSAGFEQVARFLDCIRPGNTELLMKKSMGHEP